MEQEFDLWGDPIPPRVETRGRPPHEVTEEKRLRVAVLRALNQSHDEIAVAMGISPPTLRRYYLRELKGGLAQKRAEVMIRLWRAVEGGNVSAMREFIRQVDKSDLTPAPARPVRPPRLGKKEQAAIDASTPDTATSMGELMARRQSSIERLH